MDEAFSAQGMVLLAAVPRGPEFAKILVGARFSLDGQSVAAKVFRTGRPARMVNYENACGSVATRFRDLSTGTAVGPPIIVESRLWGAAVVGLTHPGQTLPPIRLHNPLRIPPVP
jgi:hypothetical protein